MNLKRTTIIFVSGAAVAAWLSAAMTPGRPPAASHLIAPAPIDATGAELASEIARLRERLRPDPVPGEPTRNPFAFRSTRPAAQPAPVRLPVVNGAPLAAASVDAARLRLTLAGIAEDPNPAGGEPLRTAIISGSGQLFLAKDGDTVTDRGVEYKVGKISADSVELTDLRDDSTKRLTLK